MFYIDISIFIYMYIYLYIYTDKTTRCVIRNLTEGGWGWERGGAERRRKCIDGLTTLLDPRIVHMMRLNGLVRRFDSMIWTDALI